MSNSDKEALVAEQLKEKYEIMKRSVSSNSLSSGAITSSSIGQSTYHGSGGGAYVTYGDTSSGTGSWQSNQVDPLSQRIGQLEKNVHALTQAVQRLVDIIEKADDLNNLTTYVCQGCEKVRAANEFADDDYICKHCRN